MNEAIGARAPAWVRIVGLLGVLWNLIGVYFYLISVGAIAGQAMPEAAAMPSWATAAFAVAVFGGTLGSLGLLMLKRWSRLLLGLSLLAVIVQDVWAFLLREGPRPGASEAAMPAVIVLIAIFLFWIANSGVKKGWLN